MGWRRGCLRDRNQSRIQPGAADDVGDSYACRRRGSPASRSRRVGPSPPCLARAGGPIYRKTWWPAHRAANRAWRASASDLVTRYGRTTTEFVSKAYGVPWPESGYPVHVCSYANFGGAYSVGGANSVIVSSTSALNAGLHGLEAIVQEAMHQWDGQIFAALAGHARALNIVVPRDLTHAMIFFTAGEAVRRHRSDLRPRRRRVRHLAEATVGRVSSSATAETVAGRHVETLLERTRHSRNDALAALLVKTAAASP